MESLNAFATKVISELSAIRPMTLAKISHVKMEEVVLHSGNDL